MQYRRHEQPGCGGCLLLILMLVFLTGGAPFLFQLLGFLVFGVFFLVVAVVAAFWGFSYFIKRKISEYEKSQTETHNTFVYLLVNILVKIAQLDGTVSKEEISAIHQFFQVNLRYSGDRLYWVKELIREALQSTVNLEELLAEFKQKFVYEPRLILLELVYQILYTKAQVPEAELKMARDIAGFLDISAYDQRVIENKFKSGFRAAAAPAEHYEAQYYGILGLEPGTDFAEIKTAYRKLSMKYHPDKVAHLGEEFKEVAEKKMTELNMAYEYLQKKFG